MDLAVGGKFVFCLVIVVIFIGLGRAYRLGGFSNYQMGGKPQRDGTIFMWKVYPSRQHIKILICNSRRARLDKMVKKLGRGMFMFHAIISALYLFW